MSEIIQVSMEHFQGHMKTPKAERSEFRDRPSRRPNK